MAGIFTTGAVKNPDRFLHPLPFQECSPRYKWQELNNMKEKKRLLYMLLWYAEEKSLSLSCILLKHGQIKKANVLTCY